VGEGDTPDAPSVWLQRKYFLEMTLVRNFPDQASSTIVRRNDERVSVLAGFGIKICDFSKLESVNDHVAQNLETMIDRGA
jgi:uncharacterized protein with WD repeat